MHNAGAVRRGGRARRIDLQRRARRDRKVPKASAGSACSAFDPALRSPPSELRHLEASARTPELERPTKSDLSSELARLVLYHFGVLVGVTPRRLFVLAVAGQFIFGIVLALPGTLFGLPGWTGTLGFDVSAQANLLVVFFACQCVWTGVAGRAVDRFGCERVLAAGSAIISAGFVLLAAADSIRSASLAAALLASGGAAIIASSNTMVSSAYGERRGAMLSRMAVFGAVGALMTPVMFAAATATGVASRSSQLAAVAALVVVASLQELPMLCIDLADSYRIAASPRRAAASRVARDLRCPINTQHSEEAYASSVYCYCRAGAGGRDCPGCRSPGSGPATTATVHPASAGTDRGSAAAGDST
jgi:hypothetical protein